MATYSRVRAMGASNDAPYHPSATCGPETPSPSRTRPSLRWSSVSAAIAAAAGDRAGIWSTPAPSPIRSVCAAIHASRTAPSEPQVSEVQTESNPARSASTASSATSWGRPSQCPTWIPIRTREGYPSARHRRSGTSARGAVLRGWCRGRFHAERRNRGELALPHPGVDERAVPAGVLRQNLGVPVQHRGHILAAPWDQDRHVHREARERPLDPFHQLVEPVAGSRADRDRVAVDACEHPGALGLGQAVDLVERQYLGDVHGADLGDHLADRVDL